MDVTDTFLEQVRPDASSPSGLATVFQGRLEPVQAIPEVFRQNNPASGGSDDITVVPPGGQVPPATLIVPRRNNGPIIELDLARGQALSVQYTGFSATREVDTFLTWDDARSLADFQRGLETFDFGSQNWAFSDAAGNLAYFTSGELPLREDLQAMRVDGLPPFFVRDGTGGNEWLPLRNRQPGQAVPYEILPPQEMPHVVNPPAGFFVNANNDPAGTTLDNDPLNQLRPGGGIYYLNPGYDGFRAGRITELLRQRLGHGKVSARDMQRIQADTGLIDAEVLTPFLVSALERTRGSADPVLAALGADAGVAEAVGRLGRWRFTTPTGIAEGYDAADVDGRRLPPTRREIAASVAATIYAVWRGRIVHDVIDARVDALGIPRPDGDRALGAIKHLLETFGQTGGVGLPASTSSRCPGWARRRTGVTCCCCGRSARRSTRSPDRPSPPPSTARASRATTAGACCTGWCSTIPWTPSSASHPASAASPRRSGTATCPASRPTAASAPWTPPATASAPATRGRSCSAAVRPTAT